VELAVELEVELAVTVTKITRLIYAIPALAGILVRLG
jgi:hypothetical protein